MSPAILETPGLPQKASQATGEYPWFVLRVKSNFERAVERSLVSRGFEAYLPTYETRSWVYDRMKEREKPLFPGYVFCRLDEWKRQPVVTVPGVVHIVGMGRTLLPVDELEMKAVRTLIQSGLSASPWPFLKVGQKMLIEKGPLAGIEGNLIAFRSGYRLVLSISLLQRSIVAEIEGDLARPLSPSYSTRRGAASR